jgi:lipopolysaccharide transport system permease protein
MDNKITWTHKIYPKNKLLSINLKEIWNYKDLIWIFVKRDIISANKQTILGPLWFFLAPLFTVFVYTFVFNNIAGISTDDVPAPLFYLAGTTVWNYFQACFLATSTTFTTNASLFGKVYFPRMVSPISTVISNLLKFFIQLGLFLCLWGYYFLKGQVEGNSTVLLFPIYVALIAGISLGLGIIISSLTTKYRDLTYFISFGVTLLMYITPVIYPLSSIPAQFKFYIEYNPIAPIIEAFRFGFTNHGQFNVGDLVYSASCMVVLLFVGIILFNKTEKTFMDTV